MTHETDPGTVSPRGLLTASPELRQPADDQREALRVAVEHGAFTSAAVAADALNVSTDGLLERVVTGELDAVVVEGELFVPAAQLHLRLATDAAQGYTRELELRSQARLALRAFLAARPVTGSWATALGERRPLVCARRGASRVHYGIEYHSVVLRPAWISTYAAAHGYARMPELATLPIGPALTTALAELPGVSAVRHARPLDGSMAHKLTGWVRVDAGQWPVQVPPEVAELVEAPR